jgi:hypothetical protein
MREKARRETVMTEAAAPPSIVEPRHVQPVDDSVGLGGQRRITLQDQRIIAWHDMTVRSRELSNP